MIEPRRGSARLLAAEAACRGREPSTLALRLNAKELRRGRLRALQETTQGCPTI